MGDRRMVLPRDVNPSVLEAWRGKFHEFPMSPTHAAAASSKESEYWRGYALARTCLNRALLADVPRSIRVLEVGVDKGVQLRCLASLGFHNTTGTHVQMDVMRHARHQAPEAIGVQASGLHLPFANDAFDMVCTSGLMGALCDGRLERLMRELYRCTSRWLWGWERFTGEWQPAGLHPAARQRRVDFAAAWQQLFPDLHVVRVQQMPTPMPGGGFQMFLLEKGRPEARISPRPRR